MLTREEMLERIELLLKKANNREVEMVLALLLGLLGNKEIHIRWKGDRYWSPFFFCSSAYSATSRFAKLAIA